MRQLIVFLLAVAGSTPSLLASQAPDLPAARGIGSGDEAAIEVAATSEDPRYVPILRRLIEHPPRRDRDEVVSRAEFALAKLDDQAELQRRWCSAISEKPSANVQRLLDLSVGGWFSIRALARVLDPQMMSRFEHAREKYLENYPKRSDTDIIDLGPRYEVLLALEGLVPDPPVRVKTIDIRLPTVQEESVRQWLAWIDANKDRLSQLRPLGESVKLTVDACK